MLADRYFAIALAALEKPQGLKLGAAIKLAAMSRMSSLIIEHAWPNLDQKMREKAIAALTDSYKREHWKTMYELARGGWLRRALLFASNPKLYMVAGSLIAMVEATGRAVQRQQHDAEVAQELYYSAEDELSRLEPLPDDDEIEPLPRHSTKI